MAEEMIKIENVNYEYTSFGDDDKLLAVKDVDVSIKKESI